MDLPSNSRPVGATKKDETKEKRLKAETMSLVEDELLTYCTDVGEHPDEDGPTGHKSVSGLTLVDGPRAKTSNQGSRTAALNNVRKKPKITHLALFFIRP